MFKDTIEQKMKALGIKQTELAETLNISRQALKYKIDNDSFTRRELIDLRELLKLNNEDIMTMNNFNRLTLEALNDFQSNEGIVLEADDEVYVWHWFDDEGNENVRINTTNHSPEGVMCEVANLSDIEDWWEKEWDSED